MERPVDLAQMDAEKLRDLAATLILQLAERDDRIRNTVLQLSARDALAGQVATKSSNTSN